MISIIFLFLLEELTAPRDLTDEPMMATPSSSPVTVSCTHIHTHHHTHCHTHHTLLFGISYTYSHCLSLHDTHIHVFSSLYSPVALTLHASTNIYTTSHIKMLLLLLFCCCSPLRVYLTVEFWANIPSPLPRSCPRAHPSNIPCSSRPPVGGS